MPPISAVIISFNEEANIERCIKSLKNVADEVLVIDSQSTDRTAYLAESLGAKVITHPFEGYKKQKEYAVRLTSNNYILSLDADEALDIELEKSILAEKETLSFDGYSMNRFNNYCGQWIRYSNWYPDKKIRLFNKHKGEWKGINLHELFTMSPGSKLKHLKGNILHWVFNTYEEHLNKVNKYSTIAANEYYLKNKRPSMLKMNLAMAWSFFNSYIIKRGFLDGHNGYAISSISAYYIFLKNLKARQLNQKFGHKQKTNKQDKQIKIAGH